MLHPMSMTSLNILHFWIRILVAAYACGILCEAAIAHTATGEKWMVATGHPIATDAAADVFRAGGNAVDAAVAAALTLGVVDGNNSGIGGGCLILIRSPNRLTAIDGREMAPAAIAIRPRLLQTLHRSRDAGRQRRRPGFSGGAQRRGCQSRITLIPLHSPNQISVLRARCDCV